MGMYVPSMGWLTDLYQWPFQDPKLEVPTIYKAYCSGLCKGISPQNMAKHMVLTYLHFRILKFPLIIPGISGCVKDPAASPPKPPGSKARPSKQLRAEGVEGPLAQHSQSGTPISRLKSFMVVHPSSWVTTPAMIFFFRRVSMGK